MGNQEIDILLFRLSGELDLIAWQNFTVGLKIIRAHVLFAFFLKKLCFKLVLELGNLELSVFDFVLVLDFLVLKLGDVLCKLISLLGKSCQILLELAFRVFQLVLKVIDLPYLVIDLCFSSL